MAYRIQRVDGIVEHDTIVALAILGSPHDDIAELATTHVGDWWLVYAGDTAVGFAGMRDAWHDSTSSFLCLSGIVPAHRGHGLQRRLIHARVRRAIALGKRAAISWTLMHNIHSANNLIATGFRLYRPAMRYPDNTINYWRKVLSART